MDYRELYQEVIKDHNKSPRNFGELDGANRFARGHNPLCGDKFDLYLTVEEGVIKDIKFKGSGCAISTSSASMMTEVLKGKTVEEAEVLFEKFHKLLTDEGAADPDPALGKLAVFSGVREFPVRVKCATLAWHTLNAAFKSGGDHSATTE